MKISVSFFHFASISTEIKTKRKQAQFTAGRNFQLLFLKQFISKSSPSLGIVLGCWSEMSFLYIVFYARNFSSIKCNATIWLEKNAYPNGSSSLCGKRNSQIGVSFTIAIAFLRAKNETAVMAISCGIQNGNCNSLDIKWLLFFKFKYHSCDFSNDGVSTTLNQGGGLNVNSPPIDPINSYPKRIVLVWFW